MKKLQNEIRAELAAKLPVVLQFDVGALSSNERRYVNYGRIIGRVGIIVGATAFTFVAVVGGALLAVGLRSQTSNRIQARHYSASVSEALNKQYIASLNAVTYPATTGASAAPSSDFVSAIQNFGSQLFDKVKTMDGNMAFTPASLYSNLMMINEAAEGQDALFDHLLGLTKTSRRAQYKTLYAQDYFVKDDATLQMYNASFQNQSFTVNPEYVSALTNIYAEAYKVDYSSDAYQAMADWANEKIGVPDLVKPADLGTENPLLTFLSTFHFESRWDYTFSTSDTKDSDFRLSDGSVESVPFMNHVYGGSVDDFGAFVRFQDYYKNGLKITYFTPKLQSDDILSLLEGKDLFAKSGFTTAPTHFIDLSVPKFTSTYQMDYTEALSDLGLGSLFDPTSNVLTKPFADYPVTGSSHLAMSKETNRITLDEDGTKVTSIVFSLGAGSAAPHTSDDTYVIKLDSPFVYCISDAANAPLYIGLMRNPA